MFLISFNLRVITTGITDLIYNIFLPDCKSTLLSRKLYVYSFSNCKKIDLTLSMNFYVLQVKGY